MLGKDFIDIYLSWLREKTTFANVDDYIEITTPFLDSHNDHIQIYVKQDGERIFISDDGYTLSNLAMAGCDLSSQKRRQILQTILNGFGVKKIGSELTVEANRNDYPQKKHAMLQAIMSVSDMFMLAQDRVAGIFTDDIKKFLHQHDVRFTPSPQFTGKSGFQHAYDFVIPASKKKPERLIKAINDPSKSNTELVLFSWNDTKETRESDSMMFVFLNDIEKKIRANVTDAFAQYGIHPIIWSEREKSVYELAA
jgi:hypothetical protein